MSLPNHWLLGGQINIKQNKTDFKLKAYCNVAWSQHWRLSINFLIYCPSSSFIYNPAGHIVRRVWRGFPLVELKSLVEQELLTLPEHLSSPPLFSGIHVTRSIVLCTCICFVDRCFFFCTFSFGHCVVCFSTIYEFWLPLWYLQTLLFTKVLTYRGFKIITFKFLWLPSRIMRYNWIFR